MSSPPPTAATGSARASSSEGPTTVTAAGTGSGPSVTTSRGAKWATTAATSPGGTGTATPPARSAPSTATATAGPLTQRITTRSPAVSPASVSRRDSADTVASNSPHERVAPVAVSTSAGWSAWRVAAAATRSARCVGRGVLSTAAGLLDASFSRSSASLARTRPARRARSSYEHIVTVDPTQSYAVRTYTLLMVQHAVRPDADRP